MTWPGLVLVQELLNEQHPDLVDLPLKPVAHGWDNMMFRLGEDLGVRLPIREEAVDLIIKEHQWSRTINSLVKVEVPVTERRGKPSHLFPWPWSVVRWIPGLPSISLPVESRRLWATDLADAWVDLHIPAPPTAPINPWRAIPLKVKDPKVRPRLLAEPEACLLMKCWDEGLQAGQWTDQPVWVHGDPHPGNVVVTGSTLSGLLDLGDLSAGDPATDLAAAWLIFDRVGRAEFRSRLQPDPSTWARGKAWAASFVPALRSRPIDQPDLLTVADHTVTQLGEPD